jgi:hypothetical protein
MDKIGVLSVIRHSRYEELPGSIHPRVLRYVASGIDLSGSDRLRRPFAARLPCSVFYCSSKEGRTPRSSFSSRGQLERARVSGMRNFSPRRSVPLALAAGGLTRIVA